MTGGGWIALGARQKRKGATGISGLLSAAARSPPEGHGQADRRAAGRRATVPGHRPIARALDHGGLAFEDDRPDTLAEALTSLERGLAEYFKREGIEREQ